MFDYIPVREGVQRTLADCPELFKQFEDHIRQTISNVELHLLLNNKIPDNVIQNSISLSLQYVSELARVEYDKNPTENFRFLLVSEQLWNPVVASLTDSFVNSCVVDSAQERSFDAKKKKKMERPSPQPLPEGLDISSIHSKLNAVLTTRPYLYKNPGHTHIRCSEKRCTFCSDLFQSVNITQCVDHKPCTTVGYYPHVGPALWSMMKQRHARKAACTLQLQRPKPHEIQCLRASLADNREKSRSESSPAKRARPISPLPEEEESIDIDFGITDWESIISMETRDRSKSVPPSKVQRSIRRCASVPPAEPQDSQV